jgi:hypothetical protein
MSQRDKMTQRDTKSDTDQLANVVYGSLSMYGRMWAIILLCVAIATLVVGILLLANNSSPCNQYVTATIANSCGFASCCTIDSSDVNNNYVCNLLLNYTVDGVQYTNVPLTVHSSTLYSAGQKITVCYSTDDAKQITLRQTDNTTAGIVITTIGAISLLGTAFLNYSVWSNKKNAAIFGGFEALK